MRFFGSVLTTTVLILSLGHAAQAGALNPGANQAVHEQARTIDDFANLTIRQRLHLALSDMIATGARALAENGHPQQAAALEREWITVGAILLKNSEDLGDHRPLSQWLADAYTRMEALLGPELMKELRLDDIYVVNHAIPVVMYPRGNWSKREYARHFVPLAGIVTYWTSYGSCMGALAGHKRASRYCDKVAMILRNGMISDIAPRLSDFVFVKLNKANAESQFPIGYEQLVRRYRPEIARIQNQK